MPHGYLKIERRERSRERGGGVAVDEDAVRLPVLHDLSEAREHVASDVEERLPRLHHVQVAVRLDAKDAEHLVEHLAVLAGGDDHGVKLLRAGLKLVDKWAHLDSLRAGAEDEHDLLAH